MTAAEWIFRLFAGAGIFRPNHASRIIIFIRNSSYKGLWVMGAEPERVASCNVIKVVTAAIELCSSILYNSAFSDIG